MANGADSTISVLDGVTGQLLGDPLPVAGVIGGILVHDRVLYVTGENSITPIDELTLAMGSPIELSGYAHYAVGAGSLWASYPLEGVIRRFDLGTYTPHGDPIRGVSKRIGAMDFIGDTLMVADFDAATVVRIRPNP